MTRTTTRRLRDFRAPTAFACTVLLVAGLAACGASTAASESPAQTVTTCPIPGDRAGTSSTPSPLIGDDAMSGMSHAHGDHPSASGTGNCGSGGSYATTGDRGTGAGG